MPAFFKKFKIGGLSSVNAKECYAVYAPANILLGKMAVLAHMISIHQSWVIHLSLSILVCVATNYVGVLLLDISTFQAILCFNIFVASVQMMLNFNYFILNCYEIKSRNYNMKFAFTKISYG